MTAVARHAQDQAWNSPARKPAATPAGRWLSPSQRSAVAAVMRLFVEDDRATGVPSTCRVTCAICIAPRPRQGAIRYGDVLLCNRCATSYELARMQGDVRSVDQYVRAGRRMAAGRGSRRAMNSRAMPDTTTG